jgi:hypothetical protein
VESGAGTGREADKIIHGTTNRGERCGTSKLTEAQVLAIRSEYAEKRTPQATLAKRYGVAQATISFLVNRKRWVYIPECNS